MAGHHDDPGLLQQIHGKRPGLHAGGADVHEGVKCALGSIARKAGDGGESIQNHLPAPAVGPHHAVHRFPRALQGGQCAVLGGRVDARRHVFLQLDHVADDAGGAQGIPHTPAGHGVGLGEGVDHNGPLPHPGQHGHAEGLVAVIDQLPVDLVGDDPQIVAHDDARQPLQGLPSRDAAGRVGRRVDDHGLGLFGNGGLQRFRCKKEVVGRVHLHKARGGGTDQDLPRLVGPARIA